VNPNNLKDAIEMRGAEARRERTMGLIDNEMH
jgi:hypothetical protein